MGSASQHVTSGYLNNDAYPDLVVCNSSDDDISVLLNDGKGGFNRTDLQTGSKSRPSRSFIADFNGDGRNDIAVLHAGATTAAGNTVSVFLSTSTAGVFQTTPSKVSTGTMSVALAAGKLSSGASGPNDIVIANQNKNTFTLARNSGSGSFTAGQTYAVGGMPQSIALGDFNGDGYPDVVTGNMAGKTVTVMRGKGDRTFLAPQSTSAVDLTGYNLVPVLLPGDNHLDLAAPNLGKGGAIVLRGKGDGTFQAPELLPGGSQSHAIAVGDLNSDGLPDLVTANFGSGDISIFMSDSKGGFDPAIVIPVTPAASVYVNCVTLADLNNDGLDDVAVTLSTGQVRVLLNTSVFVASVQAQSNSIGVGNFTSGTVTLSGPAPDGGAIVTLTTSNAADPVVSVPPVVIIPAGQNSVAFDIVARRVGSATVTASYNGLSQSTTLTVVTGDTTPPPPPNSLNGDLDGDGRLTLNDVVKLLRIIGGGDELGS